MFGIAVMRHLAASHSAIDFDDVKGTHQNQSLPHIR
jgi:hypothetical protein